MIRVVMPSKYITNWRLQKVYDFTIISEMVNYGGWKDTDEDKSTIEEYVNFLTERAQQVAEALAEYKKMAKK